MTTTTETAPTILTAEGARRLTARLRDALVVADDLLVQAYKGQAWQALGYATWAAYVTAELPELQLLQLRTELRRERVAGLLGQGLSQGAVATMLGVGKGTINRDRDVALQSGWTPPATVLASDGRTMAATQAPAPRRRVRRTDRAVELIAAAGPDGLDVRGVQAGLRCQRNEASATLTRLHDASRIAYLAPARRGLFGRYTVTP
jgi:hypothetical protein